MKKYVKFSPKQIQETKKSLRTSIFFLLLCIENNYEVDINKAFDNLLYRLGGLNKLLLYQQVIVEIMSLLVSAKDEYNKEDFDYYIYRKLILDAGVEVLKIEEGD